MSDIRVRFAPSPTGHVHIGNIRAAIFNWLFARHNGGKFLVRVEDTDRERNTPEAIESLFDCMNWLGLDFDEEPFYQSSQRDHHLAIAQKLIDSGNAYKHAKGDDGSEVTIFRMPYMQEEPDFIKVYGDASNDLHADIPVKIDYSGITFGLISRKGKAIPQENLCLAGFKDLKLYNEAGDVVFELAPNLDKILAGDASFEIEDAVKMTFIRRAVTFTDIVKGELSKPLDSMKDLVIVKSNGDPLFHLANICDDITQGMTHIVRGDDHVENTYRHIFVYHVLGEQIPHYGHLPMIVNQQKKPLSKRDGDAFVGDFREKGYLADALFNYLMLLGWSPGENLEKIDKNEAVKRFELSSVKSTAAQMDYDKLYNINGQYMAELEEDKFLALVKPEVEKNDWFTGDDAKLAEVAKLMQSRVKLVTDVSAWSYFFTEGFTMAVDEKRLNKVLGKEGVKEQLLAVAAELENAEFSPEKVHDAIVKATVDCGLNPGKLNQAVRIASTGAAGGAELFDTLVLLGKETVVARIRKTAEEYCG